MTISPYNRPPWHLRAWHIRIPHWLGFLILALLWIFLFMIMWQVEDRRGAPIGGGAGFDSEEGVR